jgi:hypothetical protein
MPCTDHSHLKKYRERKSPAYPANQCEGKRMQRDGRTYVSSPSTRKKDGRVIYRWKLQKSPKKSQPKKSTQMPSARYKKLPQLMSEMKARGMSPIDGNLGSMYDRASKLKRLGYRQEMPSPWVSPQQRPTAHKKTIVQLRREADTRTLSQLGSRSDLLHRLGYRPGKRDLPTSTHIPYIPLRTVKELREMLKRRGLSQKGNKSHLARRLRESVH